VRPSDLNDVRLPLNKPVSARRIVSQALEGGRWVSLFNFDDKYFWKVAHGILKILHSNGNMKGPIVAEAPYGATKRFVIQSLSAEQLLQKAMLSPCRVLVDGVWNCKMRVVVDE